MTEQKDKLRNQEKETAKYRPKLKPRMQIYAEEYIRKQREREAAQNDSN